MFLPRLRSQCDRVWLSPSATPALAFSRKIRRVRWALAALMLLAAVLPAPVDAGDGRIRATATVLSAEPFRAWEDPRWAEEHGLVRFVQTPVDSGLALQIEWIAN